MKFGIVDFTFICCYIYIICGQNRTK